MKKPTTVAIERTLHHRGNRQVHCHPGQGASDHMAAAGRLSLQRRREQGLRHNSFGQIKSFADKKPAMLSCHVDITMTVSIAFDYTTGSDSVVVLTGLRKMRVEPVVDLIHGREVTAHEGKML